MRNQFIDLPWGWRAPTTAVEAWHYTNLMPHGGEARETVFGAVETVLRPKMRTLETENAARADHEWAMEVGEVVPECVTWVGEQEIHHTIGAGQACARRWVIEVPAGETLILRERMVGDGWLAPQVEIRIGAGAKVVHGLMQEMGAEGILTRRDDVRVGDGATYERVLVQRGGKLTRVEPVVVTGRGCKVVVKTLHETADGQLHDHTVQVRHMDEETRSEVTQRNVVRGEGVSVFGGKFYVDEKAQRTDAYMQCRNLLLGDGARAHQKPELEIYADDVKCSHGASTGGLDEGQVFALRARGLSEAVARELLVGGFLGAFFEGVPAQLKEFLS